MEPSGGSTFGVGLRFAFYERHRGRKSRLNVVSVLSYQVLRSDLTVYNKDIGDTYDIASVVKYLNKNPNQGTSNCPGKPSPLSAKKVTWYQN